MAMQEIHTDWDDPKWTVAKHKGDPPWEFDRADMGQITPVWIEVFDGARMCWALKRDYDPIYFVSEVI